MSATTDERLMGYHLFCDVKHDFGTGGPIYNIGKAGAAAVNNGKTGEDDAMLFFLGGTTQPSFTKDFAARTSQQITFTVPDKTASFQNWKAPILFQGGNDKIGIIQDAGEFITQRIGAKNVIAFGSILDPAGKPIRPDQEPIWFQPQRNAVTIPLNVFGFDTNEIQSIEIADLTAGTVKAGYTIPSKPLLDGVGLKQIKTIIDGKPKPINNTDVAKAGFFTSIKKAENVGEELVTSKVFATTALANAFVRSNEKYFYIGKTLGDTMLVASAMNSFLNVKNPYYGIGNDAAGTWRSWSDGSTKSTPSVLALKTGDRLNWLRAILMNVPTIYEDQAKGSRKIKEYRFFPGLADAAAVRAAILADFDTMKTSVDTRYTDLQTSLTALLEGTKINKSMTNFAPGGSKEIKSDNGAILAGRLIGEIKTRLGSVKKRVTDWIVSQKQKATVIPVGNTQSLRVLYQTTLDRSNACSPQSSELWIKKGKQEPYLSSKLIVANVPPGVKQGEWPLTTSLDIALRNAFSNINRAGDVTDATYSTRIATTDIQNRFFEKLIAMRFVGQRGGDDESEPLLVPDDTPIADVALDPMTIQIDVNEVIGDTLDVFHEVDDNPSLKQTGGAFLVPKFLREDPSEFSDILQSFPRTQDVILYFNQQGFQGGKAILLIYDILRRRTTNRIVDPILLDELLNEFYTLLGGNNSTPYIAIQGGDMSIFDPEYTLDKTTPSSTATVLFDAYTYFVNARNASEFLEGEVTTQSVKDFEAYETAYLAKLGTMRTRSGTQLLPVESTVRLGPKKAASSGTTPEQRLKDLQTRSAKLREAELARRRDAGQEGGLRTRRPLYANNDWTSSSMASNDNARLRKRPRSRSTSRVRKQSGSPKTRRQRNYVDRV